MRTKIIVLIFCLGIISQTIGQVVENETIHASQELYDFHIKKKKANNLAGWLTLGGGTAMIITGLSINAAEDVANAIGSAASFGLAEVETNKNEGSWLIYLGGGIGLSSIYFFNKASKHKKKANLQLINGAVGFNKEYKFSGLSITYTF